MTKLALRDFGELTQACVSDIETRRPGKSYSIDTLTAFRQRFPSASIWWLIGADTLHQLPTWKRIEDFPRHGRFAVSLRNNYPLDLHNSLRHHAFLIPCIDELPWTPPDISSSEIRHMLKSPHSRRSPHLSEAVFSYIQAHKLYQQLC